MVMAGIRNQGAGVRKNPSINEVKVFLRFWKFLTLLGTFLLLPVSSYLTPTIAKDCGTHGTISPITEEDPIAVIQAKLKEMEGKGELEHHNREIQKKTKASVERPKPVEGISKATESRVLYFDPTYLVDQDIKDHTGKVFHKKGTRINPLETISLSHTLLFFDGDDPEQKVWAKEQIQKASSQTLDQKGSLKPCPRTKAPKVILVKGAPLSLAEEWSMAVYFDQGGHLTKKLGIKHVPTLVTQEKMLLRIEEIYPGGKDLGISGDAREKGKVDENHS